MANRRNTRNWQALYQGIKEKSMRLVMGPTAVTRLTGLCNYVKVRVDQMKTPVNYRCFVFIDKDTDLYLYVNAGQSELKLLVTHSIEAYDQNKLMTRISNFFLELDT